MPKKHLTKSNATRKLKIEEIFFNLANSSCKKLQKQQKQQQQQQKIATL
jgi:hypothetical protein